MPDEIERLERCMDDEHYKILTYASSSGAVLAADIEAAIKKLREYEKKELKEDLSSTPLEDLSKRMEDLGKEVLESVNGDRDFFDIAFESLLICGEAFQIANSQARAKELLERARRINKGDR